MQDKVVANLTNQDIKKISRLKEYTLSPAGNFGYKKAEVAKGGIKTNEIDNVMQSKF